MLNKFPEWFHKVAHAICWVIVGTGTGVFLFEVSGKQAPYEHAVGVILGTSILYVMCFVVSILLQLLTKK